LWVDKLEACKNTLEEKGLKFTPGGIRKGASGHNVCFIHPKSAVGVLVELVQAPSNVIKAYMRAEKKIVAKAKKEEKNIAKK
jgi:lactoylglutathione lyase